LIRHVSFDIEFHNFSERNSDEIEVAISETEVAEFEDAVRADVMSMIEGLENYWNYSMRIFNVDVEDPASDETPWDHDDMHAAYQGGIDGMGSSYFLRWLADRLNEKRGHGIPSSG
jgi:hypothetical protein